MRNDFQKEDRDIGQNKKKWLVLIWYLNQFEIKLMAIGNKKNKHMNIDRMPEQGDKD